jgi:transposase
MAIWQDLIDDHGFTARYASVKRYVARERGSAMPEARVVIMTAPGEEAQVDYGEGPMVRHAETGKYRRTRLFVMTLGNSRKSVRLLTWKSSSKTWAELHEISFRRLGGAPRVVVLDNLREGVIAADVYDPTRSATPVASRSCPSTIARPLDPNIRSILHGASGHLNPFRCLPSRALADADLFERALEGP